MDAKIIHSFNICTSFNNLDKHSKFGNLLGIGSYGMPVSLGIGSYSAHNSDHLRWHSVAAVRLAANRLAEPAAFAGCGLWLFES